MKTKGSIQFEGTAQELQEFMAATFVRSDMPIRVTIQIGPPEPTAVQALRKLCPDTSVEKIRRAVEEAQKCLKLGNKIEAIKQVRAFTAPMLGLKEAKDFVEQQMV